MLKNIIIFAAGAGLGAAVAYAALNSKYEKQYQKDYSDLQAEKDRVRHLLAMSTSSASESESSDISIDCPPDPIPEQIQKALINYGGYFKSESAEIAASIDKENDRPDEGGRRDPYLISEDEFSEKKMWYDKVELYYYSADNVICDDCDELCDPDIYNLIGDSAIPELENTRTFVCVRNDNAASDYLIRFCDSSYTESH